ncbi:MAG: primosomal protein N' [Rhodothermales bacterium]|nr:primosomal protein N' [Rhodothermales bacterium]
MIVEVALPLPIESTFSYSVPAEWTDEIGLGYRVVVPFGSRTMTGVVVAMSDEPDPEAKKIALKSILDLPDAYPAMTDGLLKVTEWVAEYYVCGPGEAMRAALPPGIEIQSETVVQLTDRPAEEIHVVGDAAGLVDYLTGRGEVPVTSVRRRFPAMSTARLRRLERDDIVRLDSRLRGPRARAKLVRFVQLAPEVRHPDAAREAMLELRGAKQRAVMSVLLDRFVDGDEEVSLSELLEVSKSSSATVTSLEKKRLVNIVSREELRTHFPDEPAPAMSGGPELHPSQAAALGEIQQSIDSAGFKAFLLRGVTGSGKTEVYLAALGTAIDAGRSGIILVPEIALTPQMVRRYRARFGDAVSVLHSRMSMGERFDAWRNLREGRHRVVIGPRSAVFAPVENLGLIVVDEEHEQSYKQQDPSPRYHARDVAVMRAFLEGATCVLGSATPSLESYSNAQHGKYRMLSMPDRVPVKDSTPAVLPTVQIVDLVLERKKHRLEGTISTTLKEAIASRLDRQEQVILLQNRRGYAPVLVCDTCGYSPMCPDCSVTFTYHKSIRRLRCHYCGRTQRPESVCPSCGAAGLQRLGAGTQRVEEELVATFPSMRILRMDLDTTGRKHSHHDILSRFGNGEADVLLGTQMVAKGLDFARVTLVGVINADTELLLPDFRSEERTFQLLTQVAGRAGRADMPGEVYLQTRNPDNSALGFATSHDYEGFAEYAMRGRKELGYPPFGQVAVVEFNGPEDGATRGLGTEWTELLRQQHLDVRIHGPHPAFIPRVKRRFRYQTVVRAPHRQRVPELQPAMRATNAKYGSIPPGYRIAIDIDAIGIG